MLSLIVNALISSRKDQNSLSQAAFQNPNILFFRWTLPSIQENFVCFVMPSIQERFCIFRDLQHNSVARWCSGNKQNAWIFLEQAKNTLLRRGSEHPHAYVSYIRGPKVRVSERREKGASVFSRVTSLAFALLQEIVSFFFKTGWGVMRGCTQHSSGVLP